MCLWNLLGLEAKKEIELKNMCEKEKLEKKRGEKASKKKCKIKQTGIYLIYLNIFDIFEKCWRKYTKR